MVFCCKIRFLQFTLFCHEIVLSRFTRYCVEKIWAKNCARGEKMTNMRCEHKVHQPNHQVPQAKQTGSFCASVCGNVWIENLDFSNYVFQCFSCTLVKVKTATPLGPPIATDERTF